jgi:hypothetical protein
MEPRETLRGLFTPHGIEVQIDGEWLTLPRGCRAQAVFGRPSAAP